MIGDQARGQAAQRILDVRSLRKVMFPSELFDEFAWNMMLDLFVGLANNRVITERDIIARSGASESSGRRWIEHLVKDGQVAERHNGDDVVLTTSAITQLRRFLDEVLNMDNLPARE
ncbi:hypothetical protein QP150_19565 [Sphingomonas sp. 22L2VL55-3]